MLTVVTFDNTTVTRRIQATNTLWMTGSGTKAPTWGFCGLWWNFICSCPSQKSLIQPCPNFGDDLKSESLVMHLGLFIINFIFSISLNLWTEYKTHGWSCLFILSLQDRTLICSCIYHSSYVFDCMQGLKGESKLSLSTSNCQLYNTNRQYGCLDDSYLYKIPFEGGAERCLPLRGVSGLLQRKGVESST